MYVPCVPLFARAAGFSSLEMILQMGMSSVMRLILENQAEIMQEIQSLREQIQHFHHLL